MTYYWKDLEQPLGNWCGLSLEIKTSIQPTFKVPVYNNSRIKLVNQDKTIFWATVLKDHYNVLLLKSYEKWAYNEMPIPPISSSEVEKRKNLNDEEYFKEWYKFFANCLSDV